MFFRGSWGLCSPKVRLGEIDQNDETTVTNTASLKSKKYVYLVHPLIIVKI